MNTPKHFKTKDVHIFKCELSHCPVCGNPITLSYYTSGRKFIQTLDETIRVGYRQGRCSNKECPKSTMKWRSSQWQQLAPEPRSYSFDVIGLIGRLRHYYRKTFEGIHQELLKQVTISESQVRIMSDKQQGLIPALEQVFPKIPHGYCQSPYLLGQTGSSSDEPMKKG